MEKINVIRRIWRECFPDDTQEWMDMYFRRAYTEECALTLEISGEIVSSLLLQPYGITFHGHTVAASYISGAATRRKARGHGYMHTLMNEALNASCERGDMVCTLIPAQEWLRFYYSGFGFASVFYRTIERYTSVHPFPIDGTYRMVSDADTTQLYDAFCRMMDHRACHVIHSYDQFVTIMEDNRLSGGVFRAVEDCDGHISGMAWGMPEVESDTIRVVELLYDNLDARNATLHEIQCAKPGHSLTIMAPASDKINGMAKYGMARVVNARQVLGIIAEAYPDLHVTVRVSDSVIAMNNHTYELVNGSVAIMDDSAKAADLDVSIETLTAIIFSAPRIGAIMGLPAVRPHMSLMLD